MARSIRITGPLNQRALAETVAARLGTAPAAVQYVQQETWEVIALALAAGHNVTVMNFGCWKAFRRRQHQACNPRNGAPVTVPAHWASSFKVAPRLAEVVRGHEQAGASIRKFPKGALTSRADRPGDLR